MPAYSGLYDGVYGSPHTLLADTVAIGSDYRKLGTMFGKRPYGRAVLRELIKTLTGAAAGSTATATHKRVQATVNQAGVDGGSVVPIETVTSVNRATAAADTTRIDNALVIGTKPTYAADRSGVGGGAKLGY
jgi:hypothetical protein